MTKHLDDALIWAAYTRDVRPLDRGNRVSSQTPISLQRYVQNIRSRWKASWKLDLHGMTLAEAYQAVKDFVSNRSFGGSKTALIITGLSGSIRKEFPKWVETMDRVKEAAPTNGGGAFLLRLHTPSNGRRKPKSRLGK